MESRKRHDLPMVKRRCRATDRNCAEQIATAREHRLVGSAQPELPDNADLDADLVDEDRSAGAARDRTDHGRDARFPKLRACACGRLPGSVLMPDLGDRRYCRRLVLAVPELRKAGRRDFRPRQRVALNHRGAGAFGKLELPTLFDTLEYRLDALIGEVRHHGVQQREARPRFHQPGDPLRIEFDDVGLQRPDALDVGIMRAVVVDGDPEAVRPQRLHEIVKRFA